MDSRGHDGSHILHIGRFLHYESFFHKFNRDLLIFFSRKGERLRRYAGAKKRERVKSVSIKKGIDFRFPDNGSGFLPRKKRRKGGIDNGVNGSPNQANGLGFESSHL